MNRLHARRGIMMVEMIVTIGLIAVAAAMASRLVYGVIDAGRDNRAAEQAATIVDRVVSLVRRDTERAAAVRAADGDVAVGDVTWRVDDDALARTQNGREQRFGPLPAGCRIGVSDGRVNLSVGGRDWAFRPIISGVWQ